jgi:urea carboxylase-associated protein 2
MALPPVDYEDVLPGAAHWSMILRAGRLLRLIDLEGGANVGMLLYNPQNLLERYNAPDTLKCQHTFRLTQGHCLYSDMGRIFCSIVEDTVGWHDTACGTTTRALVAERWGEVDYQTARNGRTQNGHDSFLIEAAKYGLDRRDLAANVNWFSRVSVGAGGRLAFNTANTVPGASVSLRFEMDTLVLLHTCPHPLDPSPVFPRHPVRYQLMRAAPVGDDDECVKARPENRRGFDNNRLYHLVG